MFDQWCNNTKSETPGKRLWQLTERPNGRDAIYPALCDAVRSHYDSLDAIAENIRDLGFDLASKFLHGRMPTQLRPRSGELGEIIASELVENQIGYRIPVKRIRYKDGREMPLRGDDFIGVKETNGVLNLLKGESKSKRTLGLATVTTARGALDRDGGRCTPASLYFLCDRLIERGGADEALGRRIKEQHARRSFRPEQIEHMMFTLSENITPAAVTNDLSTADPSRNQISVHMQVSGHQDFIRGVYEEAIELGNE